MIAFPAKFFLALEHGFEFVLHLNGVEILIAKAFHCLHLFYLLLYLFYSFSFSSKRVLLLQITIVSHQKGESSELLFYQKLWANVTFLITDFVF